MDNNKEVKCSYCGADWHSRECCGLLSIDRDIIELFKIACPNGNSRRDVPKVEQFQPAYHRGGRKGRRR